MAVKTLSQLSGSDPRYSSGSRDLPGGPPDRTTGMITRSFKSLPGLSDPSYLIRHNSLYLATKMNHDRYEYPDAIRLTSLSNYNTLHS